MSRICCRQLLASCLPAIGDAFSYRCPIATFSHPGRSWYVTIFELLKSCYRCSDSKRLLCSQVAVCHLCRCLLDPVPVKRCWIWSRLGFCTLLLTTVAWSVNAAALLYVGIFTVCPSNWLFVAAFQPLQFRYGLCLGCLDLAAALTWA